MQYVVMQNQKNMTISPLKNVFLTPVENQCYSMYKIIKKYYPCMNIYFVGYENRFSCLCVAIWTNGDFWESKQLGIELGKVPFSDQMIHRHVFPKWGGMERLFDPVVEE